MRVQKLGCIVLGVLVLGLTSFAPGMDQRLVTAAPVTGKTTKNVSIKLPSGLVVHGIEFGSFEYRNGVGKFTPTSKMPMKVGMGYGWRMYVNSDSLPVSWEEELRLPIAPLHWGITPQVTLSPDKRKAVTVMKSYAKKRVVKNAWIFADGDPSGMYTVRVRVEGREVGSVTFDVR